MNRRTSFWFLSGVCLLLLSGCSEAPKPAAEVKKEPEKPPEPVTGRYAFHQMYAAARAWAADIQGLRLISVPLADMPAAEGKSGAWQVTFVSQRSGRARSYTYAVKQGEGNLHKGVFAGPEETYTGPRGQTQPFLIAALKIDSDEAYQTAASKSKEYMKKFPDKPITYLLEWNKRFPNLSWRVIWGESVGTSDYSVFVDATTGDYLQTTR